MENPSPIESTAHYIPYCDLHIYGINQCIWPPNKAESTLVTNYAEVNGESSEICVSRLAIPWWFPVSLQSDLYRMKRFLFRYYKHLPKMSNKTICSSGGKPAEQYSFHTQPTSQAHSKR